MNASPPRLVAAIGSSLVIAALVLVALVLPAEFGVDPLGTGTALGLTELASPPERAVRSLDASLAADDVRFTLEPWESLEFKVQVVERGGLVYRWTASHPVVYEFHGEPAGGPEGFAETWNKATGQSDSGIATLPFSGWHGWFFENRSLERVVIEVRVSGFYTQTRLYRDGFVHERPAGTSRP